MPVLTLPPDIPGPIKGATGGPEDTAVHGCLKCRDLVVCCCPRVGQWQGQGLDLCPAWGSAFPLLSFPPPLLLPNPSPPPLLPYHQPFCLSTAGRVLDLMKPVFEGMA